MFLQLARHGGEHRDHAPIATPSVSFTHDPAYNRVVTMVDGTATTAYTYHPAGALGAGQVASVAGPLADDTITTRMTNWATSCPGRSTASPRRRPPTSLGAL
jgi:hypothetical protein